MTTRSDVVVIVAGVDWDDNPVPRAVRPGYGLCLRGKFGEGFDIRGPHVTACGECGDLVWTDTGVTLLPLQRHYAEAHGYAPALLP